MGYAVKLQGGSNVKMNFDPTTGKASGRDTLASYDMPTMKSGVYDILIMSNYTGTGNLIKFNSEETRQVFTWDWYKTGSGGSYLGPAYKWFSNKQINTTVEIILGDNSRNFLAIAFPHSKKLTCSSSESILTENNTYTLNHSKMQAVYAMTGQTAFPRFKINNIAYNLQRIDSTYIQAFGIFWYPTLSGYGITIGNITDLVKSGDVIKGYGTNGNNLFLVEVYEQGS